MEKDYYENSDKQMDFIVKRLKSTKIDKVYRPLIGDIMLRRRFEFSLNKKFFKRDVNTFINNVKKIEIKDLGNNCGGFDPENKRIYLSPILFKKENIAERRKLELIYSTLVHECMHAMNFKKNRHGKKQDRTFFSNTTIDNTGIMEAFTECESDALVRNELPLQILENGKIYKRNTESYGELTRYIDIVAATFGIERKKLLSEKIKGKKELQNLLNKHINKVNKNTGENSIFDGISKNICLLYLANSEDKNINIENINDAHAKIYTFAEIGINERINNLEINNIEEFEEQFDKIHVSQRLIDYIMGYQYTKEQTEEFKESTSGEYQIANTKLLCMQEILENDNIKNKLELLQNTQKAENIEKIVKLMEDNEIHISQKNEIMVFEETLKEYGLDNPSMEWRNYEKIMEYIKVNQEKMQMQISELNNFQVLARKISNIFNRNEIKLLPESTKQPTWDLSNWGIDKEQFMRKSEKIVEEDTSREQEVQTQETSLDEQEKA